MYSGMRRKCTVSKNIIVIIIINADYSIIDHVVKFQERQWAETDLHHWVQELF